MFAGTHSQLWLQHSWISISKDLFVPEKKLEIYGTFKTILLVCSDDELKTANNLPSLSNTPNWHAESNIDYELL